jgi:hypothetical protein
VQREDDVYKPNREKLNALDYAETRAEATRQHQCLLDRLRAFARDEHQLEWSPEQADGFLVAFLQEGSLPVLAAAAEGDPLPEPRRQNRKARHVLSSFAAHLAEADPPGFDCLVTVVKDHILSGVLFYSDIGQFQTRFDQLDVYCDTPLDLCERSRLRTLSSAGLERPLSLTKWVLSMRSRQRCRTARQTDCWRRR